jgi:hypothetical protein
VPSASNQAQQRERSTTTSAAHKRSTARADHATRSGAPATRIKEAPEREGTSEHCDERQRYTGLLTLEYREHIFGRVPQSKAS